MLSLIRKCVVVYSILNHVRHLDIKSHQRWIWARISDRLNVAGSWETLRTLIRVKARMTLLHTLNRHLGFLCHFPDLSTHYATTAAINKTSLQVLFQAHIACWKVTCKFASSYFNYTTIFGLESRPKINIFNLILCFCSVDSYSGLREA